MSSSGGVTPKASVKKGYEVVMARGQQDLDLADLKMFNFLLFKSYSKLNDRTIHEIPVADILNFLGHSSVARLEKSLKTLGNVKIDIDYQDGGVDHSVSCHFLSFDVSKTENGMLTYAFDPILLRFLFEPKVYARINMKFLSQFKTIYGAKLFEIMTLYQHRFHRTWAVSIPELRRSLGVSDGQYERFDNLRRSVIDKAVKEVNSRATFGVSVEFIKGGRGGRVVEVRFSVVPKSDVTLPLEDHSEKIGSTLGRDPDTVDMLDGRTDAERDQSVMISPQATEEGKSILIEANLPPEHIEGKIDQWRNSLAGERPSDPDLNFLRWLSIDIERDGDTEDLGLIDGDVIGTLLADFE